jgi:AraC-like DNA-binding protein
MAEQSIYPFSLTVSAADIAPLKGFAEKSGLDFAAMLEGLGLASDLLDSNSGGKAPLEDYFRILARLSFAAQDETCQLSSRPLIPGTTEFVLSTLAESPDLFTAMKRIAKSYNLVHGGVYNRVERRRNGIVYIIDDKNFPYAFDARDSFAHSLTEGVLIFLHALLSHATGRDLFGSIKKIYTRRSQIDAATPFLAFWNAPVQCNAQYYALIYDLSAGETPIKITADETLSTAGVYNIAVKIISDRANAQAPLIHTTDKVVNSLEAGIVDQNRIAVRLGVSIATLRRRLAAEGESFRKLRDRVLNERAKSLLRNHLHSGAVAQELGFSDIRSFSRAFKQWNGMTPPAYAKSLLDNSANLKNK